MVRFRNKAMKFDFQVNDFQQDQQAKFVPSILLLCCYRRIVCEKCCPKSKQMKTVASIFQDAATSATSHRKNVSKLLKHSGSDHFWEEFLQCILLVLQTKKDVSNTDTALQFLTALFNEINDDESAWPDCFHDQLIEILVQGIQASNKDVRARSSQILALYMNIMDEIHESSLRTIRIAILERIHDKSASVRINSAICLCRLQVWHVH
jgi:condensin complex subunit 3